MQLKDMTILIAGASGGIGGAIATQLGQHGATVALHYHHNHEKIIELQQRIVQSGGKAHVIAADLTQPDQVTELYAQATQAGNPIDAIVHCATSPLITADILATSKADIEQYMQIYVYSLMQLAQLALPGMIDRRFGRIIGLTSSLVYKPSPKRLAYMTAKSALHGMMRSVASEYGAFGIRSNLIAASLVPTALVADISERALQKAANENYVKRLATPDDIAQAALYLLSDAGDFITGNVLSLTGGEVLL
jgi:3-oxoacyl-[acyl-carrier protein] reductase